MNDQDTFGFGLNSGVILAARLFKGLEGVKLEAAIRAAEKVASERLEEISGTPYEDLLAKIEPLIAPIRKVVDDA